MSDINIDASIDWQNHEVSLVQVLEKKIYHHCPTFCEVKGGMKQLLENVASAIG